MEPLEAGDPRVVGPFRLTHRLGSGGMGRVFLGESPAGRRVAVKLVREDLASSPGFRARFRREAKLAMRAGGFWAAQVVDADPDARVPWIASQYVDGVSLSERVARQGPLGEWEVRRLGGGLAEALASFHKSGLVHRDLKPSNVLLLDDGPRVIDFGISKALETLETAEATDLTRVGTVLGTPGFMAPEQALGQAAGPAADVFSLGALLVYAATGAGPFGDGPSHALLFRVVYEEPDLSRLPHSLRELAEECLRKAPEDRPSADGLVTRLASQQPPPDDAFPHGALPDVEPTGAGRGEPNADGEAETGPQELIAHGAAFEPESELPPGGGVFAAGEWGAKVFWRRVRGPLTWAAAIDVLLLVAGGVSDVMKVASTCAFLTTMLYLIYGVKAAFPLLRARTVRVAADGLSLRHGSRTLTVPWRDVASVTFVKEKNERGLALTAHLAEGADVRVPRPLRAGDGVLKCTIASAAKQETRDRENGLESALRSLAGGRYQQTFRFTR
ncbi:hypothetical protein GCM10012287_09760 [Streptomyces daqingensis]|uniref:Protein kinase domain-containing protein n=1 Tax=Streptomyces daqingensis TaxID=1472640 RepID=A0ABQ2LXD0_9ACTN|nr:serine/threonine-protein kinase [Streptomyces daqingensis]GGO44359.1 hypothetical protein GCM10012287_09760 [Streptomyces daqingensis]